MTWSRGTTSLKDWAFSIHVTYDLSGFMAAICLGRRFFYVMGERDA